MSDILDDYREWADEHLQQHVSTHSDRCHMWHDWCMIHRLAAALKARLAAGLDHVPRWIPVSERLPERQWDGFSEIVVVAAGNSYFLGRYYRCYIGDECHECGADVGERWYIATTAKPTHWMPLPEPPEVKSWT